MYNFFLHLNGEIVQLVQHEEPNKHNSKILKLSIKEDHTCVFRSTISRGKNKNAKSITTNSRLFRTCNDSRTLFHFVFSSNTGWKMVLDIGSLFYAWVGNVLIPYNVLWMAATTGSYYKKARIF